MFLKWKSISADVALVFTPAFCFLLQQSIKPPPFNIYKMTNVDEFGNTNFRQNWKTPILH